MVSPKVEVKKCYEILKNQSLERNEKSVTTWSRYKNDLEVTKSVLSLLPKKVKHDIMVPIGSKALMYGKIVHSNEFLVNLGETWFVNRSGSQAIEICDRRIKTCDEMLKKLETELQLITNKSTLPTEYEAFGHEERPEIIEYVTEDENEEWKKQHRLKEKKYRQQLAELRNQEKKKIETEEDLWKHLDELELQEELEDELNRLNDECSSDEDNVVSNTDELHSNNLDKSELDDLQANESNETSNCTKVKRGVSFSSDYDLIENEPLRLEIKHSEVEPVLSDPNSEGINSPSDIYTYYKKLHGKTVKSVLKKNTSTSLDSDSQYYHNIKTEDSDTEKSLENELITSTSYIVKDVVERNFNNTNIAQTVNLDSKKISKFKSHRMKN